MSLLKAVGFFSVMLLLSLIVSSPPLNAAEVQTLRVAVSGDIIALDPARISRHFLTEVVQRLVYAPLVEVDSTSGRVVGGLAMSFVPRDALTWQFEFEGGPGRGAYVADLARHLRRATSAVGLSGFPSPARDRLSPISNAEASGTTLTIRLSEPWPALPAAMASEPAARVNAAGTLLPTGSFELERWDHGNRVVLRRTDASLDGGFGRIWFEVVPSAEERLRQVLAGSVHIAMDLPPDGYWRLRRSSSGRPVVVPQTRVHFVELDVSRPPFSDVRVRRALNLAVDTNEVIRRTMQDQAVPVATVLSPVMMGYEPEVVVFGYDPVLARQLLAQAGYPQGFHFELDVLRSRRRIAEVYREMLADVGITVTLRVWDDWSSLRGMIDLGRRQAWVNDWSTRGLDPKDAIWPKLHSTGSNNLGGFKSVTLDSLLSQAEAVLNPDERLEHYRMIQRYLRQEAPYLFGYVEFDVYGAVNSLEWQPGPGSDLGLGAARLR